MINGHTHTYIHTRREKRIVRDDNSTYRRSPMSIQLSSAFLQLSVSHDFRAKLQIVSFETHKNVIKNVGTDQEHYTEKKHWEECSECALQGADRLQLVEMRETRGHGETTGCHHCYQLGSIMDCRGLHGPISGCQGRGVGKIDRCGSHGEVGWLMCGDLRRVLGRFVCRR